VRVKAEIRKRLRGLRKTTPASACAERSARIVTHLEELAAVRAAKSVALFWPIEERHEVDLRGLDASLRARGVRVAYPTILSTQAMVFRFVDDPVKMTMHELGFLAPRESEDGEGDVAWGEAKDLDVIVAPAIAIDPAGHRIGYGAGYYDRALEHATAVTVGVAFDFQLVVEVPATATDVPVEWVVTDRRVLHVSKEEASLPLRGSPWGT